MKPLNPDWLDMAAAAAYVGCRSVKAFYSWRKDHLVPKLANGCVAKADLDRALRAKKPPRRMAPASLENLRLANGRRKAG